MVAEEAEAWKVHAVCRTRPDYWWDFGDGGNRLALALCRRACPVFDDCAGSDPEPAGVILAGVAWTDAGKPAAMCHCGRPIVPKVSRTSSQCITCDPGLVPIPRRKPGRKPKRKPTVTALVITVRSRDGQQHRVARRSVLAPTG